MLHQKPYRLKPLENYSLVLYGSSHGEADLTEDIMYTLYFVTDKYFPKIPRLLSYLHYKEPSYSITVLIQLPFLF